MKVHRIGSMALALALVAAGCASGDDEVATAPADGATTTTSAPEATTTTGVGTAALPARPSAGCGTGAEVSVGETTDEVLDVAGQERTWRQHLPATYDGDTPLPLVIQLHGLTQPHTTVEGMAGFEALGEQEGFIVLTPAGREEPVPFWAATTGDDNPDLQLFDAMLDEVTAGLCVDEARIYSTGISNGALMSWALACTLSDRLAAIAPVAGVVLPEPCDQARPVPAIAFYGDADSVLPFDGGLGAALGNLRGGGAGADEAAGPTTTAAADALPAADAPPTVPEKAASWAAHLGCEDEPTVERVTDDVRLESWTACDGDAELLLYVVEGGGHTWPGSPGLLAAEAENGDGGVMGHTTDQISATKLAWAFFTRHALAG